MNCSVDQEDKSKHTDFLKSLEINLVDSNLYFNYAKSLLNSSLHSTSQPLVILLDYKVIFNLI